MNNFPIQPNQQAQLASEIIANAKEILGEETIVIPSKFGGFRAIRKDLKTGNVIGESGVYHTEEDALSNLENFAK